MLNSAELIRQVLSSVDGQAAPARLRQFLRIPQAWQALRLRASQPGWNPENISAPLHEFVRHALDSHPTSEAPEAGVDRSRLVRLVEELSEPLEGFLDQFLAQPLDRRAVTALRWDSIVEKDQFIHGCLQSNSPAVVISMIDVLLANMTSNELIPALADLPALPARVFKLLRDVGESELEAALTGAFRTGELKLSEPAGADGAQSILKVLTGHGDFDSDSLRDAWESNARQQALIAERMADSAVRDGNEILAAEALAKAVDAESTPDRRARLAALLVDSGRWEEAQVVLDPEPAEFAEIAVHAACYWGQGSRSLALQEVQRAKAALAQAPIQANQWIEYLANLLDDLGDVASAQSLLLGALSVRPSNAGLQVQLARISNQIGDYSTGEDAAAIAGLLTPESQVALRELATSLQGAGKFTKALPIWRELSDEHPQARKSLVECCLQVGDTDTALQVARELVEVEEASAEEMVLLGRALLASGQYRAAKSALERATDQSPEYGPGWIALADCLKRNSDPSASQVLPRAVQSCPESAELMAALAIQQSENDAADLALNTAHKANRMGAREPEFLKAYAGLLSESGDLDAAYEILAEAHADRPADKGLRFALAEALEARQQSESAYGLIRDLEADSTTQKELLGRLAAKYAHDHGDGQAADQAIGSLSELETRGLLSAEGQLWLAHAFLVSEKPEAAMIHFAACAKDLDDDHDHLRRECIRGEAESAIAAGQISRAISTLELARDSEAADAQLLALLAEAYSLSGMYPEALVEAQRALNLAPDHPAYRRLFVEACRATGSWQVGLSKIESWQEGEDLDVHLSLDRALFLSRLGRQDEARSAVARALLSGRQDPDLLAHAQHVLQEAGEWAAAKRILSHMRQRGQLDETLMRELASVSSRSGDLQTASEVWSEIAERSADDQHSMLSAADCLHEIGDLERAIHFWEKALALDPGNQDLHARLARGLMEAGQVLPALHHYQVAVELSDSEPTLTLEAARANARHGSPDSAEELARTILDSKPEHVEARQFLAKLLLDRQMSSEAEAVLAQDPTVADSPHGLALRAMAALDQGDHTRAAEFINSAANIGSSSPSATALLSVAAVQAGMWHAALGCFDGIDLRSPANRELLLQYASVRGRISELSWLLREIAKVDAHAPTPEMVSRARLAELEAHLQANSGSERELKQALVGLRLAFGEMDVSEPYEPQPLSTEIDISWQAESLAIAHLRRSRPEDTIRILADFPASNRLGDWSAILAGVAHLQSERPQLARKAFSAAREGLWSPVAHYLEAQALEQMNEPEEAIRALNRAVVAWPDEAAWQRELGYRYLSSKSPETAIPHLQQATELAVHDTQTELLLARSLRDAGHLAEAAASFEKTLAHAGEDPGPWREAAQVQALLGQHQRAAELFEQALALDSTDPASLIGVSSSLRETGEIERAHEHATLAVRHAPNDPSALIALAEILALKGRPVQALSLYDEAAALDAPSYELHKARSDLLLEMGRPQEAMQALKTAADQAPGDIRVWLAIAEVFEVLGELNSATDAIRQALTIEPSEPVLKLALARLARKRGQLDQALAELSELQQEAADHPGVAIELGLVHQSRREFRRALSSFQRAIEIDPSNSLAHYLSGMVLKEIKAYPRAADSFKKAVEIDPKDTDALHQLAAVRALELVHGGMNPTAVTS